MSDADAPYHQLLRTISCLQHGLVTLEAGEYLQQDAVVMRALCTCCESSHMQELLILSMPPTVSQYAHR